MSREEFMRQLENLLSDISEEERKEALEYYRGYFEDAGEENEERILHELESPEKVAQTIKIDLGMGKSQETEHTYYEKQNGQSEQNYRKSENNMEQDKENTGGDSAKGWKILLVIVIAVFTSPIWVGAIGGLLCGAIGLICGLFGILIGAAAAAGALCITGLTICGIGIGQLTMGGAATGVALMGAGFLILSLAVLAIIVCVWLYGRMLPWLIRGMVSICRRIFCGKGRAV